MEYSYDEYSSDEKILLESLPRESPGIVDYIFQHTPLINNLDVNSLSFMLFKGLVKTSAN
jgi:hypothetical protein